MIGIEKGLLDFTDAQVVDYRGRRMERELEQRAAGVHVFVPPSGITAVRLHGLRLRDA
jgi:hypothetical protein